jgi:DNA gyrase subunit A
VEYALPLVDGQGNFGSVDGDSPAAMRAIPKLECKIFGRDYGRYRKETVDFQNFDDTL